MHPENKKKLNKFTYILSVLVVLFTLHACDPETPNKSKSYNEKPIEKEFALKLKGIYLPVDTTITDKILPIDKSIQYVYRKHNYKPLWINKENKPTKSVEKFLIELKESEYDGLDPEKYNYSLLKKTFDTYSLLDSNNRHFNVTAGLMFDTAITKSYLALAHDLLIGTIIPKMADHIWFTVNDSTWNAPELLSKMDTEFISINNFRSSLPTYQLLRKEYERISFLTSDTDLHNNIKRIPDLDSIKGEIIIDSELASIILNIMDVEIPWYSAEDNHVFDTTGKQPVFSEKEQQIANYQYFMGIKPTGIIDKNTLYALSLQPDEILDILAANMERIRWMQKDFGNLYLLVDIPLMELFLRINNNDSLHMRVVVGKPDRPTPAINATMSNIVINPPWGVPPTILKNDVLPGLKKSGKKYLAKKGLKAYDKKGKVVDATTITARNYRRYTYRQEPGTSNALGVVKFNLKNPWDIYLHDTPHRGDFVKWFRALSSGCIRVQKPQEMAIYILSVLEKKNFDQTKLSAKIKTHKTESVSLSTKIPVTITYLTAFEDSTGSHIRLLNDVYHHDEQLISMLNGKTDTLAKAQ